MVAIFPWRRRDAALVPLPSLFSWEWKEEPLPSFLGLETALELMGGERGKGRGASALSVTST